uniref:Large ribosomal subunit protein uL3c n=1 Tax=Gastroclonium compressum TaxID=1852973 RepID=A0A173G051_GASCM|nr:ribosomal protein L3 [Coeloseira compressa]ANH09655.1 ribosomal protein L3 [Coeloseira compressa]
MSVSLLGTKIGMTQIFNNKGQAIPVSIIKLGPCYITEVKTKELDGYNSIQIGYKKINKHRLTKAELGHLKKNNIPALKHLYEYKLDNTQDISIGKIITVSKLNIGDLVKVSGVNIGKGFCGCQKRHKFSRGPMTHGSKNHRQPGSIGAGTTPGKVFRGKKMAGRMGNKKTTIRNLEIIDINENENMIVVKGSIPGKKGNLIYVNHK